MHTFWINRKCKSGLCQERANEWLSVVTVSISFWSLSSVAPHPNAYADKYNFLKKSFPFSCRSEWKSAINCIRATVFPHDIHFDKSLSGDDFFRSLICVKTQLPCDKQIIEAIIFHRAGQYGCETGGRRTKVFVVPKCSLKWFEDSIFEIKANQLLKYPSNFAYEFRDRYRETKKEQRGDLRPNEYAEWPRVDMLCVCFFLPFKNAVQSDSNTSARAALGTKSKTGFAAAPAFVLIKATAAWLNFCADSVGASLKIAARARETEFAGRRCCWPSSDFL